MQKKFSLLESLRNSAITPLDQKSQFLAAMSLNLRDKLSSDLLEEMIEVITPLLDKQQYETAANILIQWMKTEDDREKELKDIAKNERSSQSNTPERVYTQFKTIWGTALFFEKLLTPEQLGNMSGFLRFCNLITKSAIFALRENLVTPAEMAIMKKPLLIYDIFSENGINALKNETYSFRELASLPSTQHIKCIITPSAQQAYRDNLFTLENISNIPEDGVFRPLKYLFNEWGIQLLREQFLTWDNLSTINIYWLKEICSEWGLEAFRKGYINIQYIRDNTTALNAILTEGCLTAFEKGYFTPQQISGLSRDFIYSLTCKDALLAFEDSVITFDDIIKSGINSSTLSCAVSKFGRKILQHTSLKEFAKLPAVNAREFTNYFGAELVTRFSVTLSKIKELDGYWQTSLVASKTGLDQIKVEPGFIDRIIQNPWG